MTKDLLEDYPYICRKLKRMEGVVIDTVEGSSPEFPYTKHTVSIRGVPEPSCTQEMKLAQLRAQRQEIEAWVAALPTEKERTLVELHALQKLPWSKVFRQTGDVSPDAARKQYERILKKYL
ncbi:MAG: hypothetical protein K2P33_00955 [Acutalibacter sp.]|nr:hypothetical protein [Acutalibacter sp.]